MKAIYIIAVLVVALIVGGIGMLIVIAAVGFLFVGTAEPVLHPLWGVGFSQKHAAALRLDWQKVYLAMLDDLRVKRVKTSVDWDLIEPERDEFYFLFFGTILVATVPLLFLAARVPWHIYLIQFVFHLSNYLQIYKKHTYKLENVRMCCII